MLKNKLLMAYDAAELLTFFAAVISQYSRDLEYAIYFILVTMLVRMMRKDYSEKLEKESKEVEIVFPLSREDMEV
jgi:hypothetical protein